MKIKPVFDAAGKFHYTVDSAKCSDMAVCKPLESWRDFIVAMGNAAHESGMPYNAVTRVINYSSFAEMWFNKGFHKKPLDKKSPETKKLWETLSWIYSDASEDTHDFAEITLDALEMVHSTPYTDDSHGGWDIETTFFSGTKNHSSLTMWFAVPTRPTFYKDGAEYYCVSDTDNKLLNTDGTPWEVYAPEVSTQMWLFPLERLWNAYKELFLKELEKRTKQAFRNAS